MSEMLNLESFDLISDIHLDFWVSSKKSLRRQAPRIQEFVYSLVPVSPSRVLVISGDMGHDNQQNLLLLQALKTHYSIILITWGNHDLYLESYKAKKYFRTSLNRWKDMQKLASRLEGVHILDGTSIMIDGITFGGTGMWYDYSYGIKNLAMSQAEVHTTWENTMNDYLNIRGNPDISSERDKLSAIFDKLDVVVTHVGPDCSHSSMGYVTKEVDFSFYYFDGQAFLDRARGKIWCYGHIHQPISYLNNGCLMVNNALGYPVKKNPLTGRGIVTIPLQVNR